MGDPGWRVRAYCILQKASERLVPRIDRWAQFAPVGRGELPDAQKSWHALGHFLGLPPGRGRRRELLARGAATHARQDAGERSLLDAAGTL